MRIDQSTLSMDAHSNHKEVEATVVRRGLVANGESQLPTFSLELEKDVKINEEVKGSADTAATVIETEDSSGLGRDRNQTDILQRAAGTILGAEISLTGFERTSVLQSGFSRGPNQPQTSPFDMLFDTTRVQYSTEHLSFATNGSLQTEDGRAIEFSMELALTRHQTLVQHEVGRLPLLLDPLVLSFDDGLSSLSGSTFSFDLTGDGLANSIGALSAGSGFLSLDKNHDGIINNGLELFGPSSGLGFSELADFDLDGNSWIDENDPVFSELLLWMGAGGEKEELVSLKEAGVGAIALASAETDFDLKDDSGAILGTIARAGLFVMENGEPISIQELDLNLDVDGSIQQLTEDRQKDSLEQALGFLQHLILRRRNRLAQIARSGMLVHKRRESLTEKFWQWQESRNMS